MSERPKDAALKAAVPHKGTVGSNPTSSAGPPLALHAISLICLSNSCVYGRRSRDSSGLVLVDPLTAVQPPGDLVGLSLSPRRGRVGG